nr:protein nrt1/ ptr family 2.11 [Quercus suber]
MEKEEENAVSLDDEPVINYRGITVMAFNIGNETFEKLGTNGSLSNLLVYLTTVFNMKSVTATTIVNIINGTSNMTPLLGAFPSDSYFGRYKTMAFASISSLLGLIALTLTAAISKLHPPHCATKYSSTCVGPMPGQLAFLGAGFSLLIIGAGGIRPCNLAFGADQFNPETESGKRSMRSFFNCQTSAGPLGLQILRASCSFHVKVKPNGSPLAIVAQVVVAASKKRRLNLPHNLEFNPFNYMPSTSMNSKLPYTDQFRFLDKAAIITAEDQINPNGSAVNPWKLCSLQQVEEVKCLARVIPVWASLIIFSVIMSQNSYAVFQALQSDRRLGNSNFKVPAASYAVFTMPTVSLWIPIYDKVLVPSLRKLTGKEGGITLLQRMGIGIVLSVLTMLVSGLVEEKRRNLALTRPTLGVAPESGAISSMSGLWLIPQLVLTGLSEAFCAIGQVEFLFNRITARAPTGKWLSQDLNKGKLDYFYHMVAALGVLNFGFFLVCAKWYRYKGDGEIKLPTDQLALEINKAV